MTPRHEWGEGRFDVPRLAAPSRYKFIHTTQHLGKMFVNLSLMPSCQTLSKTRVVLRNTQCFLVFGAQLRFRLVHLLGGRVLLTVR